MIDPIQGVLLFVVVILTILLFVLGLQVYFILRELRQTVSKANKVLDDTGTITENVSGPIASFSTLLAGLKTGASIAQFIKGKKKMVKRIVDDDEE